MARGEILKRVQDDVGGVLAASPMAKWLTANGCFCLFGILMQSYSFILLLQNKNGIIFACFVKFYWNALVCQKLPYFFAWREKIYRYAMP